MIDTHKPNAMGEPLPRVDGIEKVTGRATFTADVPAENLAWAKTLRSPHPHARIVRIDTTKAAALPGVYAVLTGEDVAGLRFGRRVVDIPLLADGVVRFVGDQVAAVVAVDEEVADRALALIDVDYEVLPAVFDAAEAMLPSAPLLHPDMRSYQGIVPSDDAPSNVSDVHVWGQGDIDVGFREAEVVVENTFILPVVHQLYMESHACQASIGEQGRLHIWANNKTPYNAKWQVAAALGIEPDDVLVHPVTIGGDFGGKGSPMDTPVAYLLSQVSGRPVKIVMGYDEELLAANTRHPSEITVRTGFKNDGTLTALEVNAHFDSGAYGAFKAVPNINLHAMELTASCYRVPVFDVRSSVAYTNTVPSGHMRSPGGPQITFAVESQLNIVAAELGIDPAELRVKNLIRPGDSAPNGEQWVNIKAVETLQAALDAIGWGEPLAPNTGRGLAMYERGAIGGDSSCKLVLHADGALTLILPIPDPGQGGATVMQQIAAEHLGVEPARIAVRSAPTDELPFDLGVGGSRTTFALGVTVAQAAETLMARLQEHGVAAPFEETAAALIASEGGDDVIIDVYRKIPFLPDPPTTEFTAQAAEVKVDPETGQVTVLRLVTAHDVGTIINPAGHQGQIAGGAIQGFGMGMIEELAMADGKPLALNLADYKIPSIMDIPALQTILVARDDGPGPFNSGAIAEAANVPTAAAIANAVHAATGKPVRDLPVSAEYVVGLLRG